MCKAWGTPFLKLCYHTWGHLGENDEQLYMLDFMTPWGGEELEQGALDFTTIWEKI